ncbi:glutamate decarboxylase [Candidatus Frankia alpina]|uniref:Glutamate decarboxylase n=1 Tax=Candidatus Frankia alpina TaxID=2699483 RepID=A0A4S5EKL0_9ACTN|nr:glutamate decarboxylase [Candidatus Frankia alpina]THJ72606.1 glutamate decarboxylase [Candidatus Frankia alpina]
MALHGKASGSRAEQTVDVRPQLVRPGEDAVVPRFRLPQESISPETAYQIVHDELMLDGNARLNLATFVTTWMDPQADRLMAECAPKNMIDKDEYPQTAELEKRCVNILADLWHAPDSEHAVGCSTTGSSEACMLAGLALLRRWRARRRAAGAPADRPNLVMGVNVQVCWDKFARYWDVEPRLVPMAPGRTHLTADEAAARCDENTIGVVAILGSTFDGSYEPVAEIVAALDRLAAGGGPDVPVHVDAASGGFIAPFCDPELVWDFQLDRVVSINASGHKYGLVYPGVGWVLWRDRAHLPDELVFEVDYLGGKMPTFSLNFSRPGAQVVAQYYTLLQLGFSGYRRVAQACRDNARWLADEVARMGPFELVSDGSGIPAFAFRLRDEITDYTVFDVSELLRTRGWLVPAYRFPADLTDLAVLRVVVRHEFSRDLAEMLIADLRRVVDRLTGVGRPFPSPPPDGEASFHH